MAPDVSRVQGRVAHGFLDSAGLYFLKEKGSALMLFICNDGSVSMLSSAAAFPISINFSRV